MSLPFARIAAFYDLLYKDKDYAGETRFVLQELDRHGLTEGDLLNLGCGTGRHDLCFAREGKHVLGVDLVPEMINEARKSAADAGARGLTFAVGDARQFRASRSFAAVVSLFHVASYQTEDEHFAGFLDTAAAHLPVGGLFLFDFWHSPGVLSDPPTVRVKRLSGHGTHYVRIAEPEMFPGRNLVDVNYTVFCSVEGAGSEGPFERFAETHRMRHFGLPELRHRLAAHGFEVLSAAPWLHPDAELDVAWYGYLTARKTK